ncbi:MAG: CHASE domain-containing protein, partial [Nitrospinota bacterium]
MVSFFVAHQRVQQQAEKQLEERAASRAKTLQHGLHMNLDLLRSIGGLYAAFREVDRQGFRLFVRPILEGHGEIQALEWIPRVTGGRRAAYEEAARKEGYPAFQFTQRSAKGTMERAARREEYFPVYFVEPLKGNEKAFGFDLGSNPTRRAALVKARDEGQMVATARIRLVQETGQQFGFLIFLPVYRKGLPHDAVQQRRENLEGFVLGVYRIGDMVESISRRGPGPGHLDLYVYDESADAGNRFLHFHPSRDRKEAIQPLTDDNVRQGQHSAKSLTVADRKWTVVFRPVPGYFAGHDIWIPWTALAAGLLLTLVLTTYLGSTLRHTRRVERLVNARTEEARRAEEFAQEARVYAESIVEAVREPLLVLDEDLRVKTANASFYRMFQVSPEETEGEFIHELGNRQWDIPRLRALLEEVIPKGNEFRDFEVDDQFPTIGRRTVLLDARPIRPEATGTEMILLAIEDITERKQAQEAIVRERELRRSNV